MTVSLYSCVCHFFSDALNWYHQAFLLLYTLSYGLIQNFQNNEVQPDSKERYWVVLCAVPLFTILYKMVLTFDSVAKSFKGDQRNLLSSSFLWCCLLRCKRWLTFASGHGIFIMWPLKCTLLLSGAVHLVLDGDSTCNLLSERRVANPFKSTLTWNHLFSTTLLIWNFSCVFRSEH